MGIKKMTDVIDIKKAKHTLAVKKAYRNWKSQCDENFDENTIPSHISIKTLKTEEGRKP